MYFIELNSCPACFGVRLCHLFGTDRVQLTGWQRFSLFNNDLFNVKNIYYGTMNKNRVVFKKMAHQSEWVIFDDCQQKASCFHRSTASFITLLPCSNMTFISKFTNAFLQSTDLDRHDSEISLGTTIQINLEPIVLSGLSGVGFPFPSYYGACGRVGVVSDEGSNFVSYLHSPFQFRAYLARELLISMHQLTVGNAEMIIYYPDVNLENFVYNENERRVKIIDLEYLIIVERELFSQVNHNDENIQNQRHPNKFCNIYMPDFNIEQVCRYVLSPSIETTGKEMSSDFLHDIPEDFDDKLNLSQTIMTCAQTESKEERMAIGRSSSAVGLIDVDPLIEVIQTLINRIDELTRQAKQMHFAILQPTADSKLGQELDDKTEEIKNLAYKVSAKLKKLDEEQTLGNDYDITSAQWRIKESQIFVLTRQFRDIMIEYNKEAMLHRERSGNRRPYDELDEMIDNGHHDIFSIPIMVETQKIQQTLDEIEARYRDIMKVEKSIKELHQMFLDLAILVTDQGEMVDSIEHNVFKAMEYVEDAAENVYITEKYRDKELKKKRIVFMILLFIVISIVIFILTTFIIQRRFKRG
ncbi:hypothetical protein I4U23_018891 [Adineta vaga]|nr:hypothetical protein I4U23_018891 [Adineta vaga]